MIYEVYRLNESTGAQSLVSAHKTVQGAVETIPEWARDMETPLKGRTFGVVKNYTYYIIREMELNE